MAGDKAAYLAVLANTALAAVVISLALVLLRAVLPVPEACLRAAVTLALAVHALAVSGATLALIHLLGDGHHGAAAEQVAAAPLQRLTLKPHQALVACHALRQDDLRRVGRAVHAAEVLLASDALAQSSVLNAVQLQLVAAVVRVVEVPGDVEGGSGAKRGQVCLVDLGKAPQVGAVVAGCFEAAKPRGAEVVGKVCMQVGHKSSTQGGGQTAMPERCMLYAGYPLRGLRSKINAKQR